MQDVYVFVVHACLALQCLLEGTPQKDAKQAVAAATSATSAASAASAAPAQDEDTQIAEITNITYDFEDKVATGVCEGKIIKGKPFKQEYGGNGLFITSPGGPYIRRSRI